MARPKVVPPAYLMRGQALVQALEGMSTVLNDSGEFKEYFDLAQYWFKSLGPFLNPSSKGEK